VTARSCNYGCLLYYRGYSSEDAFVPGGARGFPRIALEGQVHALAFFRYIGLYHFINSSAAKAHIRLFRSKVNHSRIRASKRANNDGLYNRIQKLEAEVVKTGLKTDFYVKEFKELKSDTQAHIRLFRSKVNHSRPRCKTCMQDNAACVYDDLRQVSLQERQNLAILERLREDGRQNLEILERLQRLEDGMGEIQRRLGRASKCANNDGLYNRIQKLEAEVVKTSLKTDIYIKEFKEFKELKSDTQPALMRCDRSLLSAARSPLSRVLPSVARSPLCRAFAPLPCVCPAFASLSRFVFPLSVAPRSPPPSSPFRTWDWNLETGLSDWLFGIFIFFNFCI